MRKIDCVLGVDMGTGGARVGIFDLKGNPIVFCEEPYPLYTPASAQSRSQANGGILSARPQRERWQKAILTLLASKV